MTPSRTSSGDFRFDIDWTATLGYRIQQSAETNDVGEYHSLVRFLKDLRRDGQVEVLRDFQAGRIPVADLKAAARRGLKEGASTLRDSIKLQRGLWVSISDTLPKMGRAIETRRRYETSFEALRRLKVEPLGKKSTVADLAEVDWKTLSKDWGKSGSDWNHLRRAVSAFLSLYLGDVHHAFRLRVLNRHTFPWRNEIERVPDLTIDAFMKLAAAIREDLRPILWTVVLTGFRKKEYYACGIQHLRPLAEPPGVVTPGSKTEDSSTTVYVDRGMWPWIEKGIPAPCADSTFRRHFTRARRETGQAGLTMHDLRHCLGQWAEQEGCTLTEIQSALRHRTIAMTARYTKRRDRANVATKIGDAIRRKQA